jgi:hypothetical protein
MSDDSQLDPVNPASRDPARQDPVSSAYEEGPPPASPHLLTCWFGLMATGGIAFGIGADEHPFGRGVLAHPLAVLAACMLAGLLTLRFLHARPLLQLISAWSLAAGLAIGVACYFLGWWFGANLMHMP